MRAFRFIVRYPDGRVEDYTIESERLLIGTGAHCDIRLPVDQGSIEHVAVSMAATTVVVEALSFEPPPTINGLPMAQRSQLLPNSVLGISQVQIQIAIVDVERATKTVEKKKEKTSPLVIVIGLVALPIGLYMLLAGGEPSIAPSPPKQVPPLWGDPITTCPQTNKQQALALANDQYALAVARRERRAFKVQEGVRAVPQFETAGACFETAGQMEAAKECKEAAEKLRKQVSEDFHSHRVRMEHSISVKDVETAAAEVRILMAFTEGLQGDYVNWLSALDRDLQLKYGSSLKGK